MLQNGWNGGATLSHPDIVRSIHRDYLERGVDLIASNTFASARNVVDDAGVGADFERYNRVAVELAIEARTAAGPAADHVVVAGGVSNWSFSGNRPSLDDLHSNTVEQAVIMRDAGADLISLEMMVDLPRMTATLDAVTTVGLPVWVGFTIGPEQGMPVIELPAEIPLREGGLQTIRQHWDGPLGVYAHASEGVNEDLTFDAAITPQQYAAYEPSWRRAGATMIGGCCGIGPDHIEVLAHQRL